MINPILTSIPTIAAASLTLPKPQSNAFTVDANTSHATRASVEQNLKFAAITAAVSDILLDDETSPSNSLLSSSSSDDAALEKGTRKVTDLKKRVDDDNEKDIDEISPIFDDAGTPQGTPTHATNSFSFSDGDGGQDFLIDDEIADQPVLCFSDKNHGKIPYSYIALELTRLTNHQFAIAASNTQLHSIADTATLIEGGSPAKSATYVKCTASEMGINNNSYAPQVKPRHSLLSRTESLDTLSPCESICSDDMMMDFDCNSGRNSMERLTGSNQSEATVGSRADLDENQLWNEFEQKGGGMFKDWSYLLKTTRNSRQDISVWVNFEFSIRWTPIL